MPTLRKPDVDRGTVSSEHCFEARGYARRVALPLRYGFAGPTLLRRPSRNGWTSAGPPAPATWSRPDTSAARVSPYTARFAFASISHLVPASLIPANRPLVFD